MVEIEPLDRVDLTAILRCEGGNGWKNDASQWAEIIRQHAAGERLVLVASVQGAPVGYGSLLWRSPYPLFAAADIPELHDLVTARRHRHQGIATTLIAALKNAARTAGHCHIGLGVGLYADYGPAQRLYGALGYIPDGRGVTYDSVSATPGAAVLLDDDLLLWMVKTLI